MVTKYLHPADMADILRGLSPEKRKAFFDSLNPEVGAKVLRELDPVSEVQLLAELDNREISEILDEMPSDDAADVVLDLSREKADQVLQLMEKEESADVKKLLKYKEDTAGGIMTTEFVALNQELNSEEALQLLRKRVEPGPIHYIYVVGDDQKLLGVLLVKRLIASGPDVKLKEIMNRDIISVPTDLDQEEVARIVSKYDLLAVPVVDSQNQLAGIVTVDDVIDVIKEEDAEDIFRMAGTHEEELLRKSIFKVAQIRLPWLLITLIGGLISCGLLRAFQFTLEKIIALAFFIPVIMGMGGNIGIQSSTIVVRGLATGNIDLARVGSAIFKEIKVGAVMGFACGALVGTIAYFLEREPVLGVVVGISMFVAITVAATMGTLVPLLFKRLKIDPAIASGPFVTTSNDITGLIIYFVLANWLFEALG